MTLATSDYVARQAALQALEGVDAVALVPGANLLYFTGLHMHLSERPTIALFSADKGLVVIIPELEYGQLEARSDLAVTAFRWQDQDGYEQAFAAALDFLDLQGKTLGVDGMSMRVSESLALRACEPSMDITAVERELIAIRARKQPEEIAALRRAIAVSEQALQQTLEQIREGMSERQIARMLSEALLEAGSERLSFGSLVQTGSNSAFPHGSVTDRCLAQGEALLIDFGGVVADYPADITRTFCLGEPSAELARMHAVVLEANQAAIAASKPGVAMGEVDRAARAVIEAAGYGQYFIHRTGHGLGLDVHEPIPQIAANVQEVLEPGMVFTIEPGVYVPGVGGVRLEDDVLITDSGVEVLTSFPKSLHW